MNMGKNRIKKIIIITFKDNVNKNELILKTYDDVYKIYQSQFTRLTGAIVLHRN